MEDQRLLETLPLVGALDVHRLQGVGVQARGVHHRGRGPRRGREDLAGLDPDVHSTQGQGHLDHVLEAAPGVRRQEIGQDELLASLGLGALAKGLGEALEVLACGLSHVP